MILITGATGFLGAELARQLTEQAGNIRCTKRGSSAIPEILEPCADKIEWVDADITDAFALEDALQGVTQVYHCAAWVSLKRAQREPMIRNNIEGTANLVNLCTGMGIRLVHVSSVAAVGEAKPGELITENHHLEETAANDGYAISKLESEMEVWRGIAEGLDAVIVNPSIIIGPDAGTRGSGALFETVRKGLKFYTSGSIGFVDVHDVAACMIVLMNSDISGQRFIVNAENRTYQNITGEIAESFGVEKPAVLVRPWMMEFSWRLAEFVAVFTRKSPFIDKVAAQTASKEQLFDNSKLLKATNFRFKPISQSIKEITARLQR